MTIIKTFVSRFNLYIQPNNNEKFVIQYGLSDELNIYWRRLFEKDVESKTCDEEWNNEIEGDTYSLAEMKEIVDNFGKYLELVNFT